MCVVDRLRRRFGCRVGSEDRMGRSGTPTMALHIRKQHREKPDTKSHIRIQISLCRCAERRSSCRSALLSGDSVDALGSPQTPILGSHFRRTRWRGIAAAPLRRRVRKLGLIGSSCHTVGDSRLTRRGATRSRDLSARGAARAEDAQGTPTQSHITK